MVNDHDHDDDVALLSWRPAVTVTIITMTMLSFSFATFFSYHYATIAYLPFHFTFLLTSFLTFYLHDFYAYMHACTFRGSIVQKEVNLKK